MELILINHIKAKNLKAVESLIDTNPESIYERDECANTPLHYAVMVGDLKIITSLLEVANYLVNTPNELGNLPLMVAAGDRNDKIVQRLLQYKANTDLENFNGFTSAHFAAFANSLKVMKLLQEYKCNIPVPAVLHGAASQALGDQDWELTKWLLKQDGADISYKSNGLSVYDLMNSDETGSYILEQFFSSSDELIGEQAIDGILSYSDPY
jgi:ankyrin repeat protein